MPLTRGSFYADRWTAAQPREALVNEAFVRRYLPGVDPIGREVTSVRAMMPGPPTAFRIVGVVGDVRSRVTELEGEPQVYVPWGATEWGLVNVVVRTTSEPETLIPAVRVLAQSLGGALTIEDVQTLDAHLDGLGRARRLQTSLASGFALTALCLAALGLYGLLAGEVAARRQEFGVRLTLGARPGSCSPPSVCAACDSPGWACCWGSRPRRSRRGRSRDCWLACRRTTGFRRRSPPPSC